MGSVTSFTAPETVAEAVAILADQGNAVAVLAGGTDLMVRAHRNLLPATVTTMLSLHRIEELRGVRLDGDELVIGAMTTSSALTTDPVIRKHAPILGRVADRMASAQIRNVATIGGNLVNASPAGDLINPLLLLDARAHLVSAHASRLVAVEDLFTGPGATVLRPGELLTEVRLEVPPPARVFGFEKAGTRPAMECSLVTVGLACTPYTDVLREVRIAFGSLAPTPIRGRAAEAVLEGAVLSDPVIEEAVRAADHDVTPISDIRGSAWYRRALTAVFLRRLLEEQLRSLP